MKKIEHIGIAVNNLEESIAKYETILQTPCYKREIVLSEHVETAFFIVGESKIELLGALNNEGPVASYLEKKGEGMHHIAYEVQNIKDEMKRLRAEGFRVLNEEPKLGADNKWVCFVHPKDANGVLTELVESVKG